MKTALLITVSSEEIKRIRRSRYIKFQQCTMPYLASFFPADWNVLHVDEEVERIPYDRAFDVVGLTFHTPCCRHAYEIAARFRERGVTVIMGGPHVTLCPDEAEAYADCVFVGEAENTLPVFFSDFESGTLKKRYESDEPVDMSKIPLLSTEHFHRRDHTGGTLIATRGCPNNCEFCAIACVYKHGFRARPPGEVAKDYARL
ncbi:MAG: cobalamin-dependent protein, partial [Oscillospiraceae bacterium]|nr:cobalamin-dependent protein [Oscillospiraceae bacterium]